jgi:hypothetical protein
MGTVAIGKNLETGLWAALVAAAVATFHLLAAAPLVGGALLGSMNFAFDLDPSLYVDRWCRAGGLAVDGSDKIIWGRHPGALVVRPLCLGLVEAGFSPQRAAMILAAAFAGLSAGGAFLFARLIGLAMLDALLGALCFALSAQPLFLGAIPESFGLALLGIVGHFCLLARWADRPFPPRGAAIASAVVNFGVTLTNGLLFILSWIVMSLRRAPLAAWIRETVVTGAMAGAALLALILAVTLAYTPGVFEDPARSAREFWWGVNIDNSAPAPAWRVLATFLVYDFVAPVFTVVPIEGGAKQMLDFRGFAFDPMGAVAVAAWLVLLSLGIASAAHDGPRRRLWIVCGLWFAVNLLLHWQWQYRGSVWLYGAHSHFALFALALVGLRAELTPQRKRLARAALLLLLAASATSNLDQYFALVETFRAP